MGLDNTIGRMNGYAMRARMMVTANRQDCLETLKKIKELVPIMIKELENEVARCKKYIKNDTLRADKLELLQFRLEALHKAKEKGMTDNRAIQHCESNIKRLEAKPRWVKA